MSTHAPPPSARRFANRGLVTLFLGVVVTPLLVTAVQIGRGPGTAREEQLAPTPAAPRDVRSALRYPGAFRWYFEKRFGLRHTLVRAHGLAKVEGLGVSSSRDVLLGRDGWLFLRDERVLDYERNARPFVDLELRAWVDTLAERKRWLAERGIRYLVVVAPNKHSMYPEELPSSVAPPAPATRLDQLLRAVRADSDVDVLDLRPVVRSALPTGRLYHRTDTHWNLVGAWHGARAVVTRLGDGHARDVLGESPGSIRTIHREGGDLARLLGLQHDLSEDDLVPASLPESLRGPDGEAVGWTHLDVVARTDVVVESGGDAPSAVLFRDSFGEALVPWLSPCFRRAVWRWSYGFDRDLVERESPDVVIQQLVERKLLTTGPDGRDLPEAGH